MYKRLFWIPGVALVCFVVAAIFAYRLVFYQEISYPAFREKVDACEFYQVKFDYTRERLIGWKNVTMYVTSEPHDFNYDELREPTKRCGTEYILPMD
ncbi:hypothetical protein [Desmospora activa]|uniref:Uncharacterized protein n=1 Tax=Desmospora activa DSM 45169 TaxID=1121389 RepID=A0A2T4Z0I2_9BACL|nr:hypothetical protein [Desmospora activa]PTM53235.1 hypothetical protein C8J48_3546 [Desmospora activa DSM 45169]